MNVKNMCNVLAYSKILAAHEDHTKKTVTVQDDALLDYMLIPKQYVDVEQNKWCNK